MKAEGAAARFGRGFAAYLISRKIVGGFVGLRPHAPSVW